MEFRLHVDDHYVRVTRDMANNAPFDTKRRLTFDEYDSEGDSNPIAVFEPVTSSTTGRTTIREVNTGYFIFWTQEDWKAVLRETNYGRWELAVVDPSEPDQVKVRNLTSVSSSSQTMLKLGAGFGGEPCTISGIVRHHRVTSTGTSPINPCTVFVFTIEPEPGSSLDAILAAFATVECTSDDECKQAYNNQDMLCVDETCQFPEPVDCVWAWDEWPEECDENNQKVIGWTMITPPQYLGNCDAPAPNEVRVIECGLELPDEPEQPQPSPSPSPTSDPTEPASETETQVSIWNPFADGFFDVNNAPLWIYTTVLVLLVLGGGFLGARNRVFVQTP